MSSLPGMLPGPSPPNVSISFVPLLIPSDVCLQTSFFKYLEPFLQMKSQTEAPYGKQELLANISE